jgi:gas vesicle protein GvpA/GvpJ/GvpM family
MTTIAERDVALVDLIDRLLGGGVVIAGDITLAAADVDLVYVGLRAMLTSVATAEEKGLVGRLGSSL